VHAVKLKHILLMPGRLKLRMFNSKHVKQSIF